MSILRSSITSLVLLTAITILGGSSVLGAPPVPFLDDNEPGIQYLFSGDPDTTESTDGVLDCAQDAERAGTGGVSGKLHNDFLNCDNWDFQPTDWGQASFLQGAFILGESPFSDDGGWECSGNSGPGGYNPCVNSTIRAVTTYKNQPAPGPGQNDGAKMDESRDWVLSFDFKIQIPAGDTAGNDKLFAVHGATSSATHGNDTMVVLGAGGPTTTGHYTLHHGVCTGVEQCIDATTTIDKALTEGTMTMHYDADEGNYNLWHDNDLLVADFHSFNDRYDASFVQIAGGGISFENALYDNIIWGVVSDATACGPEGPDISVPGDFNCDGTVDVADLGIIGANFNGSNVTYVDGDANLDGGVDVADLGVVGANWTAAQGLSLSHALRSAGLTSVPEPATVTVLAIGLVCLGRRRRK